MGGLPEANPSRGARTEDKAGRTGGRNNHHPQDGAMAPFSDIEAYLSDSRGLRCPTTRSITICAASWTAIVLGYTFGTCQWPLALAFREMRQPGIRTPYLQPRRAAEPSTRRQSRGNKSDGASA